MTRSFPVLLALATSPSLAVAQEAADSLDGAFNAHNLHLAAFDGDLRDPMLVQRPGRLTQWDWFIGGAFEYASAPLVRYETNADGDVFSNPVLDNVVALDLSGGVTFHERFRLDVAFPLFLASYDGNRGYQGVDMGDIRLNGLVSIISPDKWEDTGVGLGAFARIDIPSGAKRDYLGSRTVAGGGGVAMTYGYRGFTATAELGVTFRPSIVLDNLVGADSLDVGVGIGYMVHETTSLNLETTIDAALQRSRELGTGSPVELLGSLRHRQPNGGFLTVGAAGGLSRAAGAARFRIFVGGGFGRIQVPPPKDMDLDGLVDELDACVDKPETVNSWRDDDGCPDQLSDLDVQVVFEGKPLPGAEIELNVGETDQTEKMVSRDTPRRKEGLQPEQEVVASARFGNCLAGDGSVTLAEGLNVLDISLRPLRQAKVIYQITDVEGKPLADAVATWKTDEGGCADAGGYPLGPDGRFEHPMGVGTHTVFVNAPGYRIHREDVTLAPGDVHVIEIRMQSTRVKVDRKRIDILERVFFETGLATIKPESYSLLDEVATVIQAANVGRVRVEGHTDDRGADEANMDLSQRRAESVRRYLIEKGVPEAQLIAVGYGETQPIATNGTAAGRAENRRVVFTLLDQADQTIETQE
jgi:outer membrane protein OmpA-like peptidoglycan-associated protein